jgi:hypothetical protein
MLWNIFESPRLPAVTTNNNVLHLAELGRSHRYNTCCSHICCGLVGHNRILPVWRGSVTPGNYNLACSDRL